MLGLTYFTSHHSLVATRIPIPIYKHTHLREKNGKFKIDGLALSNLSSHFYCLVKKVLKPNQISLHET